VIGLGVRRLVKFILENWVEYGIFTIFGTWGDNDS